MRSGRPDDEGFDSEKGSDMVAGPRLSNPDALFNNRDLEWLRGFANIVRKTSDSTTVPSLIDLRCGCPYLLNKAESDAARWLEIRCRGIEEFAEACGRQDGSDPVSELAVALIGEITAARVRIHRGDFDLAIRGLWKSFSGHDRQAVRPFDHNDVERFTRSALAFETIRRSVRDRTALYLALSARDSEAIALVANLPLPRDGASVQRVRISAFNVGLRRMPSLIEHMTPPDVLELGLEAGRRHHDLLDGSNVWLSRHALDALGEEDQSGLPDIPAPVIRRPLKSRRPQAIEGTASLPPADPASGTGKAVCDFDPAPPPGLSGVAGPLPPDGIGRPAVVVIAEMPESGSRDASSFAHRLDQAGLIGGPVPLAETPDLVPVRASLVEAWPHAVSAIDEVLTAISLRSWISARPFLFVGPPGCGKTALARKIFERLGLPHELVAAGGVSDGMFGGTNRGWSTGMPSAPLTAIIRHRIANPGFIIDEIEKAGTGRQNGSLHDVLLGMIERSSSSAWRDPYILAPVDISNVVWLATANDAGPLPVPLRQRFRIIRVDAPGSEHAPALIGRIMKDLREESGDGPEFLPDLTPFETEAVIDAWLGGCPLARRPLAAIRGLRRLVEGVLVARVQARPVN